MTEAADELYSLLVPISGARLIVPRVCVAEVAGLGQLRLLEHGPDWLIGKVGWKGREIPLVSFESACGAEAPEIASRTRAVIFHATTGLPGGYFAVLSQGLPQLVRVSASVIAADPGRDWAETAPVICRVRMINEYPLVPDLERIEAELNQIISDWR